MEAGMQVCSVCGKRKSKKFDMYFITYRMAVEFYMTEGKYLSIGRLACSSCKIKGLKGLDFSNSYLVPESGHPLEQDGRKRPREDEDEERRGLMVRRKEEEEMRKVVKKMKEEEEEEERRGEKREVVLQPVPTAQGKLATIQPLPPRPQLAGSLNQPCVGASLVEAIGSKSSQQTARLSSPAVVAEGSDQQQGGPLQKLHAALALSNPAYKPPGFTITSFSEVSEGVLQDAIHATETAVSTILSAIAPGQEEALWHHVSRSLQAKFSRPEPIERVVASSSKKAEDGN